MIGSIRIRADADENGKLNKEKHIGANAVFDNKLGTKKRQALNVLNGISVNSNVSKVPLNKDVKDVKLENGVRNAKARVDSNLRKAPFGTTSNITAGITATGVASADGQHKALTRSKSLRTIGTKVIAPVGNGVRLQRQGSNDFTTKSKTLTAKVVENPVVEQAKVVTKSRLQVKDEKKIVKVEGALRREDSNLSRKSLTKLKAAISRDAAKPIVRTSSRTGGMGLTKKVEAKPAKEIKPVGDVNNKKIVKQVSSYDLKIVKVQSLSSESLDKVEDIDANDGENLGLVSTYVNDIYDYLFDLETKQSIREKHLDGQVEVHGKMRTVLIDWINEVHTQFRLVGETFQMAVGIIDRYLQIVQNTKRSHLQLVGVTALFLAAKYEELYPPAIADFAYITDNTYTAQQIVQMEMEICKALDCNFSRPLPIHFLRRFSKAANAEDIHHAMSKYFLELTAPEYELAHYKPSLIAAASLFLSLHLLQDNHNVPSGLNNKHWSPTLEHYSRYTADKIRSLTQKIAEVARKAPTSKFKSVYNKYASSKLQKLSLRSELYSPLMDSIINTNEKN